MAEPQSDDKYARQSFSWRRMERWQIWTLAIVAVVVVILGIAYVA